jgi:hypothetical protein
MTRRAVIAWLVGVVALGALVAPGALAGQPAVERITVDETAFDPFLTAACGVPVTTRAQGHITTRTFAGGGTGPVVIRTINLALTATAGDNVFSFRDVGADVERIEPDGTAILMIIGQLPFTFTGVLKIDLETGEAILEPHHSIEERLETACAVLTA